MTVLPMIMHTTSLIKIRLNLTRWTREVCTGSASTLLKALSLNCRQSLRHLRVSLKPAKLIAILNYLQSEPSHLTEGH